MKIIKASMFFCITLLGVFSLLLVLNACTITCQNISTHGTATDVIDDEMRTDVQTSAKMNVPNLKFNAP